MQKELELYLFYRLKNRKDIGEESAYTIACDMVDLGLINSTKQVEATLAKWYKKGCWEWGCGIFFGWIPEEKIYALEKNISSRPDSKQKSKTIYIVTAGDYSDYHIARVFSDKAAAYTYVYLYNETDAFGDYGMARVEEFNIDTVNFDKKLEVVKVYKVNLNLFIDKNTGKVSIINEFLEEEDILAIQVKKILLPNLDKVIKELNYNNTCWADITVSSLESFDKAKKIAYEQYQKFSQNIFELTQGVL